MMSRLLILLTAVVTLGIALVAQAPPSRDVREKAWQANNLGVAYLEQFNYGKAAEQFEAALAVDGTFVPARVNLAIAYLYTPDLPAAQAAATAAAAMPGAPPHAQFVLGLVARSENREDEALAAFRAVLARDPDDVASLVNVGQLLLQRRQYAEAVPLFTRAVDLEPYNVSALYNLAVAQTRAGDRATGASTTAKFQILRETGYGTTYSNSYLEQGRYAEAILSTGAEPDVAPAAAPTLTYGTPAALPGSRPAGGWTGLNAADLNGDGRAEIVVTAPAAVEIFTAGAPLVRARTDAAPLALRAGLDPRGVVIGDVDNDGKPDLVVHGRGGLSVLRQKDALQFDDATAATTVTTALDVRTAALVDLDHDGDADLVFGGAARDTGAAAPLAAWRNNGDGTFADISASALPSQAPLVATAIVPTDIDLRRDIDLLVLGADGRLRLWRNMRDATFREVSAAFGLDALPRVASAALGDFTKDGFPDLAVSVVDGDGVLAVGSANNRFTVRPLAALPRNAMAAQAADADNDGLLDVVLLTAAGPRVVRQQGAGAFEDVTQRVGLTPGSPVPPSQAARALVLVDADASRSLDIATLAGGAVAVASGSPQTRGLHVRLTGQVSNRSGIGAKVEMRAGSLWQKLETVAASPAAAPADLLFGLGTRPTVDVVRVLWPAGIVQAEPPAPAAIEARDVEVVELDRKPSSCPYLYTWTGDRFEFVTDFLGGGETGYQAAPGVYSTPDPEEFVRIPGNRLKARDGRLELRVTNELEETLFLDHLSLVAVDHPAGADVFPREGLVSKPVHGLQLATVRDRRPAARVTDAAGRDAGQAAARVDRRYVDGLPLLPVRGYAKPHAVTIDLGAITPAKGAALLLTGWTDYAFSSDNVAASHAGHALTPPALQVKDAAGRWTTVLAEIGVPVGRPQTIVVDLTDRFLSSSREVRIQTSMRVYWDRIEVASLAGDAAAPAAPVVTRLAAARADLRWRGFSAPLTPDEPLAFDYTTVTPQSPWKQLPGRYTREGDVRELLQRVDDAFVVSRPGDEVAVAFEAAALPPLPAGWTRTYLLHGDGFSKEMDINSASPDQAWPLPTHACGADCTARRSGAEAGPNPADAHPASPLDEPAWFTRYNTRVVGRQVPRLAGLPR